MSVADPLAAALRVVLKRHGRNFVQQDELAWTRQLREVAQICWMQAGDPKKLRDEDVDRAETCRELVRPRSRGARRLRLVPGGTTPDRSGPSPTPRRRY